MANPARALAIFQGIFTYDAAPAMKEVKVPIRAINQLLAEIIQQVSKKP